MANEYNELEQLVNDVTNIDTARMTLRWALERLNSIEKERAELKKTLTISEDARKTLEARAQSLEESSRSRGKVLEEKEGFYSKLEATMALLSEGKLDIRQLLKKEARLDHLGLELEREYQGKFEALDKSQNSVIERWNQRLLDVESQYAKRLSESQARYDSLRQELESGHQSRLGALEASYKQKEKELTGRIEMLEASIKANEHTLEARRKDVETELLAKKSELEGSYLKLKSVLEAGFQERIQSMDNDHCEQVRSLEKTWNAERERLMAEQRVRDEQFGKSQKEMARLEALLSEQQEKHHRELIELISRKEEAFRGKMEALEKDKAAYEKAVGTLTARLENKEKDWLAQKGQLQADFARRIAEMEASVTERALALEKDAALRTEGMEKLIAAAKEEFAREASVRVETARRDLEEEKARLTEDNQIKALALGRAAEMIRDLEVTMASSSEDHHRELLAKIRADEENFRAKMSEFETEKEEYKAAIARLTEEAGERDVRFIEETKRMQKEFSDKYAELEEKAAAGAAKDRAVYEERVAALTASFEAKEKLWVMERAKPYSELAAMSDAEYAKLSDQCRELESIIVRDRQAHHEELIRHISEKSEELKIAEEAFGMEKKRLMEELELRQARIAETDKKLQEVETELMKSHQNAAAVYLGQIAEQDDKFKEIIAQYEGRQARLEKAAAARLEGVRQEYERRIQEMEEMLKSKDSLVRQGGDFWRQKQAELDAQHSELNIKISAFNEEIFAQRQSLSERESILNAQQLEREKIHSAGMSEIHKLKLELTKTIAEYKNRK